MMENRTRYASIQIYLALSDRVDARSFPGGYLVFFQGLLETADYAQSKPNGDRQSDDDS